MVEDDARHRTGDGDNDGIDDEEERAGLDQVDFTGISGQESQDAGISEAHEETDDGDDHDAIFDVIVEAHGFHLGHLFRREGNFVDVEGDAANHAQADEDGAEGDDKGEVRDDDEEHAQERSDGSGQAGAQAVVVDAFTPLIGRNTGSDNRVRRCRDDAIGHAVEEADSKENSEIGNIKI